MDFNYYIIDLIAKLIVSVGITRDTYLSGPES